MEDGHIAKLKEGGERCDERHKITHVLEVIAEDLDCVPNKGIVGDGGTDVGEGIGDHLLLKVVVGDGLVSLLDYLELLAELACMRLLIVMGEVGDAIVIGKTVVPPAMTMSAMLGMMELYSQRGTMESIRSHSLSGGRTSSSRWSVRDNWLTAMESKLRHLVKFDALRSSMTGIKDLMFWMGVAVSQSAACG
jgi:hypothetical protein